jgi:hypothetical protein
LEKKHQVVTKEDIIARPSSFVINYQDIAIFSQTYQLEKILGLGAFGRVQKCRHKVSKEERAVKIIDKT